MRASPRSSLHQDTHASAWRPEPDRERRARTGANPGPDPDAFMRPSSSSVTRGDRSSDWYSTVSGTATVRARMRSANLEFVGGQLQDVLIGKIRRAPAGRAERADRRERRGPVAGARHRTALVDRFRQGARVARLVGARDLEPLVRVGRWSFTGDASAPTIRYECGDRRSASATLAAADPPAPRSRTVVISTAARLDRARSSAQ